MIASAIPGDQDFSDHSPVLITGGTGFVGRQVVSKLLAAGNKVRIPYRQYAPPEWHHDRRLELIKVNDLVLTPLEPLVQGCARIVHLAGLAHVGKTDRADVSRLMRLNDELTARLAAAADQSKNVNFIHLSSLASITSNTSDYIINDLTNFGPVTAYGQSKRAAEQHVSKLANKGIFAISLRPPLVVGAEAKGNWRSLQKLAATGIPLPFSSLKSRRSFISVQSLAEAIAFLCSRFWPAARSGDYCIADPETLTLPEVLTELRRGMGLARNLLPCPAQVFDILGAVTGRRRQFAGLTGSLEVDASRFAATFNFTPRLPIREAIYRSGVNFRAQATAHGLEKPNIVSHTYGSRP